MILGSSCHCTVGGILRKFWGWNGATAILGTCQFSMLLAPARWAGMAGELHQQQGHSGPSFPFAGREQKLWTRDCLSHFDWSGVDVCSCPDSVCYKLMSGAFVDTSCLTVALSSAVLFCGLLN